MPSGFFLIGYFCLLGGTSLLIVFRSWNRSLSALALQSIGLGLVSFQITPPPVAVAKTTVGLFAVALLALTLSREKQAAGDEENPPVQALFRVSLLLFLFSSIVALFPQLTGVFREPPAGISFAALCLICSGLLNLGLAEHPLRSAASLLTILQGFELGYLWIEQSLLVLALLAVTDLAMVLVMIILYSHAAPEAPAESRVAS
ncbi:MAG: hypothetical protein JW748_03335 [Anaerolineales bacterium]|nr:hypothetical protein [Anaerolineales bacterium]